VTSGWPIFLTRTWASFPAFDVYGRPTTSHSPVSSGEPVADLKLHREERATSYWYRVAGLLRRKDIAIEIIEAEIRSAQREVLLEAARLVLSVEPIEAARELRRRAEQAIKRE
jgi:hypothetical protein